jgi:hypothetical protein
LRNDNARLFSAAFGFASRSKRSRAAVRRFAGPQAVRVRSSRVTDRHRGRDGRGFERHERNFDMAIIGTFTANGDTFTGTIKTLTLNA